jgi:hypothetical protein
VLRELITAQCAWGGGALPFANSSLNVPADFSWYSKFDWIRTFLVHELELLLGLLTIDIILIARL